MKTYEYAPLGFNEKIHQRELDEGMPISDWMPLGQDQVCSILKHLQFQKQKIQRQNKKLCESLDKIRGIAPMSEASKIARQTLAEIQK